MRRVTFLESEQGFLARLRVETGGERALPLLRAVLFELRVQVVHWEGEPGPAGTVEDLALVEFDGAPISPNRRLEIQVAVLSALEGHGERPGPRRHVLAGRDGPTLAKVRGPTSERSPDERRVLPVTEQP